MPKPTHKVGLLRSSLLVCQKGLVLMVSLFLLFLLSLIAVSSVSVSRLSVYSSQSFVDDYVASNAAFAALDKVLDHIHRFHPAQFSGSGSQGLYLVSAFDRNWQNISVWSSANCLPIELVPEAAAGAPCVLVEILNSSDISENLVFRVSALGIGSVAQTHVVVQAWVYQYRPSGEAGGADEVGEVTEWITELRGLKEL